MKDLDPQKDIEIEKAIVGEWIARLTETGTVGEMAPVVLRRVLESYGADFEVGEEMLKSLGEYTNAGKAEGMRAIWGEKYNQYKNWTKDYVTKYESEGKILPELKPSGIKNSGMIQFFGGITSFAAGQIDFETLKTYLEARAKNGRLWAESRKEERTRVKVPTSSEPILPSSFPPEFPKDAWEKIKTLT